MLKIERILCPVDFSEFSETAYDYAHSLARHYEATLHVLHVVRSIALDPGLMASSIIENVYTHQAADAKSKIAKFAEKQAGDPVRSEITVQLGFAAASILSFAKERDTDLIVMGTHGRRGLDRLVMGSTTEQVLRKAHCPVLAIRKPVRSFVSPQNPGDPVHIRKILCCVDFSEHSPRALEFALSLGMQYSAQITLLHVLEEAREGSEQSDRALESIEQLVPEDARNWASVLPTVRSGRPYEQIIELAEEAQTDLIVMGVRGRNAVDLAVFGSTTHRVIQLGPCPVLAVRT